MSVNASLTGRTYPATAPYAVGREKIREFAEAVGSGDVVHTDQEQARARGYRDVIAPPTFAALISQRCERQFILDPEAGIDYSRVLHGEQNFTHHRPIVAGDRLVAVLHVDTVRAAGGHSMVTTRSEITTEAGEPVCTASSTLVVRAVGS